ncbi:MAG: hypothetical protein WBY93_09470 [Candidatus Binatus sp.]
MSDQPNSLRRFTVIELPVLPIVAQSLLMPFKYLPELVKYGGLPYLLVLVVKAISFLLAREDISRGAVGAIYWIAHFVLFTPFSVTWTKLAIYGRSAIADDPPFAYTKSRWLYLLASTVMSIAILICIGFPLTLFRYGQRTLDSMIVTEAALGFFVGLLLFLVGFVRLAFIFPAIAIGKYEGISAAWKQTAGNIERLAAILALTFAPWYVLRRALEWGIGYNPPGVTAAATGCLDMLLVSLATTALAGPALAYKTLVLSHHDDTTAGAGVTPAEGSVKPTAGFTSN